jgi:hypothetical protein
MLGDVLSDTGWSEDPEIVLRLLVDQATAMLAKIAATQPGALHSHAFWQFVADECGKLADRVHVQWRN